MNDWRNARIEEAAKAMADGEHNVLGWRGHSEDEREWYRKDAAIALAVFEKAHTPTDDEREALAFTLFLIESGQDEDWLRGVWANHPSEHPVKVGYYRTADAILAAGFRCSEVPETSAETLTDVAKRIGASERSSADFDIATSRPLGPEPQGEPSGHDDGCADFYPEYGDPEGGVCKVCGDQVQGEPSAAQELGRRRVLAAAMALAGMGEGEFRRIPSSKRWRLKEQARAALRAARGVR